MQRNEKNNITQVTRRDIIDYLIEKTPPYNGRLDLVAFLSRTFDLYQMPSTDRRFESADGDIYQHMVRNHDWDDYYLLAIYLNLMGCDDDVLLTFLEQCVHPMVLSNIEDIEDAVNSLNKSLMSDGYVLLEEGEISDKPLFKATKIDATILREIEDVPNNNNAEEIALQIMNMERYHLIDIDKNSVFGEPQNASQYECDVFVIMPFTEVFRNIYNDHIKPTVQQLEYDIKLGDDFFSKRSIMSDVWSAMVSSDLVIADCTGKNPNVFYELGMAHTLDKPVIILTQNVEDTPFDIRHLRVINYEYTPRGSNKLEKDLRNAIIKLIGNK